MLDLGAPSSEEKWEAREKAGRAAFLERTEIGFGTTDRLRATAVTVRLSETEMIDLALGAATESPAIARLPGTGASDLAPLKGLTALQSLDCSRTQVSDLGPLEGLSALQTIQCSGIRVSDLTPLQGLSVLR